VKKIVFLCLIVSIVGCASNLPMEVRPDLVEQFKHEPAPSDTETHVYVIRGPAWEGGAYGLEVGLEDKLVTSLASGSYDLISMNSDFNTLYLSQFGQTFQHKFVDDRGGELLFYYFNPGTGEFNEVRSALGKSLVMQTKKTNKKPSRDTAEYYTNALMNPSVMGINLKSDKKESSANLSEYAVLNVTRPSNMHKEFELGLWSNSEIIGVLGGEESTGLLLPPGKHSIYTYINGFSKLELEVEPGKTYYAQIDFEKKQGSIGNPWTLVSKWTALDARNKEKFYEVSYAGVPIVDIDSNEVEIPSNQYRINQAKEYFRSSIDTDKASDVPAAKITPEMGL